jgi:hypothetical protein
MLHIASIMRNSRYHPTRRRYKLCSLPEHGLGLQLESSIDATNLEHR